MLHKFFEDGYWFAPKKLGYGAGLPIAWQGWVLLGAYVLLMLGAGLLVETGELVFVVIGLTAFFILTLGLVWIAKRRTRGGWKWRP